MPHDLCTYTGKVRHADYTAAQRALSRVARRRLPRSRTQGERMRVYHCERCGDWHFGHAPERGAA